MGRDRADQPTPDLFSANAVRDASAPSTAPIPVETTVTATPAQRHILPKDLGNAIKHLSDGEVRGAKGRAVNRFCDMQISCALIHSGNGASRRHRWAVEWRAEGSRGSAAGGNRRAQTHGERAAG